MRKTLVCTVCHETTTKPKKTAPGSFLIELVLWLFLILPGLIYSLWRITNKRTTCPGCGATSLVPADSPMGKKILAGALGLFLLLGLWAAPARAQTQDGAPGPWRLVTVVGDSYANFAWRINTKTGEVQGLRFQHSEENGWSLELIDLTCFDSVRDRLGRSGSAPDVDALAKWAKTCRELEEKTGGKR